jgi:hypothetical protein
MNANVKAVEFKYDSLYAGKVSVMGAPMELPDFGRWHYFAFDEKQGVILKGTSAFELADVNPGKVGTEKVNAEWKARTDWDFAFHAYDLRTNSGASGNGSAGAVFIADAASAAGRPLAEVYAALTKAPATNYAADAAAAGTYYLSLTSGMPPLRATTLSVCSAVRKAAEGASGASADFSTLPMQGAPTDNPVIIVLKTVAGKYVKIYLKQFVEGGKPGILKFDYEFIPFGGTTGVATAVSESVTLSPNPVSDVLRVSLPGSTEAAGIAVYNLSGSLVKELKAQAGVTEIPVAGWAKGVYVVKVDSEEGSVVQRIVVR